ncbi:MAG: rhodanese-like domain-containing protein [Pseudomonadota bacterium]|nr:rhodanese-like domain-containing protein [Pseudomonadota bacterium]
MKTVLKLCGLLGGLLYLAGVQAENLAAVQHPIPEAPALTQAAQALLDGVMRRVPQIDTAGLMAQLRERPETVVIDVRTPQELANLGGRIDAPRFANLQRGWLEFQIETTVPDKSTPIVVYCGVSQRSPLAAEALIKLGYSNVRNYRDGFFNWRRAGLPVVATDAAPTSFLYDLPREVLPGVWSAIGATAPGTYENSGHNNNLSFILTDAGVVVVNAGDNYLLAESLHDEIKKRSDKPVKYVVLENGQGHAMLGSSYWKEQGAKIVAQRDTAEYMEKFGHEALAGMRARQRDKAYRTELVMPDIIYDDRLDLSMGGKKIEVLHLGNAHHHGDTMVWLPEQKLVLAGDTAFHVRMPPIFEDTDTARWIRIWDQFEALGAEVVIPGHGGPTDMATVRLWTRGYLVHLRAKVAEVLARGGSLEDAYKVDQSAYLHLHTADELARINAGRVFRSMEFE